MQHYDIPKKTLLDGDDLKFASYASRVAKGILNYSQKETFILSLEGEWGIGKTSLMNFVKDEIKDEVEILHFNPWLITDMEQVLKLFFDELIKVLSYGSFKVKFNEDIKNDLKTLASLILPDSVRIDVGLIKLGYKPKNALLPENKKTLEDIRKNINNYLKDLDKKIVIIIDDIDRLTDKETEFIFRLVKGIADFDNLIYILLYDKNVVSKSLEKFKAENGQKYLEKIVQYPLSVPKPHNLTIKNLLFKELDVILEKLKSENVKYIFNEETWNEVHYIISNYIKTVRDINQIINIISFEYPIIAEEVNFTDFFIISLIKLKNHALYQYIQNNPRDFFINVGFGYGVDNETQRIKDNFNNNLKEFHEFRALLEIIFPILKEYDYSNRSRHKNKFISDIYYFENYFSFSTSDDKMSMKEYYELKKLLISEDYNSFKEIILMADKNQKSSYFIDMFYAFDEPIEDNERENIFFNVLKISRELKSKDVATLSLFRTSYAYKKLAHDILIKHTNVDDFLLNFYATDTEIEFKIKVELLINIHKGIKELEDDKKLKITTSTLTTLNNTIKNNLELLSFENIFNYDDVSYLVSKFEFFEASIDKLAEDISSNVFKSTDNFFKILDMFKTYSIVNGSYKNYSISKDRLKLIINLDSIEKYISELDKTDLTEEQNKLLGYWDNNDTW